MLHLWQNKLRYNRWWVRTFEASSVGTMQIFYVFFLLTFKTERKKPRKLIKIIIKQFLCFLWPRVRKTNIYWNQWTFEPTQKWALRDFFRLFSSTGIVSSRANSLPLWPVPPVYTPNKYEHWIRLIVINFDRSPLWPSLKQSEGLSVAEQPWWIKPV